MKTALVLFLALLVATPTAAQAWSPPPVKIGNRKTTIRVHSTVVHGKFASLPHGAVATKVAIYVDGRLAPGYSYNQAVACHQDYLTGYGVVVRVNACRDRHVTFTAANLGKPHRVTVTVRFRMPTRLHDLVRGSQPG